jgi:glycosyltransferase involved in cell wall biosynthesis
MLPFFIARGFAPVVACAYKRQEGVQEMVERAGVPVRLLQGVSRAARAMALRRLIREIRPALVHTSVFDSDIVGRLAAAGTRVPVLTSLVNTSYDPARRADPNVGRIKLLAAQHLDGFTARRLTTWFHAITNAVCAAAVSSLHISPDRVTVIPRGRDPARLGAPSDARRARAREQLGIASDAEVLVNIGRQEFQKGQRVLLRAVDEVLQRRPRAILLIAGRTGNATTELARLKLSLAHSDRVRVLGHRDDVPELLAASDLFVFPSLYEGLGGAIIEAMALGIPIVASRIPAIMEVAHEGANALLVPAGQPEPLAAAICTLLENKTMRQAFGEHGRRLFLERYTLEQSARGMAELFYHVIGLRTVARIA